MPFAQTLREEFGRDAVSFYSADTFNEMTPPTDDPIYLSNVTSAVYQVCSHPSLSKNTVVEHHWQAMAGVAKSRNAELYKSTAAEQHGMAC